MLLLLVFLTVSESGSIDAPVVSSRPAERIPLDGIVITSQTFVALTVPDPATGAIAAVEVVDVHYVGAPDADHPGVPLRAAGPAVRHAIDGLITSYAVEPVAVVDRIADVLPARVRHARRYPIAGLVASADVAHRYGLEGRIVSTDDSIILAGLRTSESTPDRPAPPRAEAAVLAAASQREPGSGSLLRFLEPSVTTYVRSDSISFDDGESVDSLVAVVVPRLRIELDQSDWSLATEYELEAGHYLSGERNDFFNHLLVSDAAYRASDADTFRAGFEFRDWSDRRSRQVIEDFNGQLVPQHDYLSRTLKLGLDHGSNDARSRQLLDYRFERVGARDGSGSQNYDLARQRLGWTALYRVRRRVTLLLDASYTDLDYRNRSDSNEMVAMGGVEGRARRFTGRIELGPGRKEDPVTGEPINELLWLANMNWRPRRHTKVDVETGREFFEAFGNRNGVISTEYGMQYYIDASLQQSWSPRFLSTAALIGQWRRYGDTDARESAYRFRFGSEYKLTPRVSVKGDAVYTSQDGNRTRGHDRWTFTVTADVVL